MSSQSALVVPVYFNLSRRHRTSVMHRSYHLRFAAGSVAAWLLGGLILLLLAGACIHGVTKASKGSIKSIVLGPDSGELVQSGATYMHGQLWLQIHSRWAQPAVQQQSEMQAQQVHQEVVQKAGDRRLLQYGAHPQR